MSTELDAAADSREVYLPQPMNAMVHRSSLSPDGRWLLVVEMDERSVWRPCRVVAADGSSSGRSLYPQHARCTAAAWSSDGRWVYFTADAGDGFHLWRQAFPDGASEQLTSGPTEEEGVAIAADGKSLITSVGLMQRSVWLHDATGERQISVEGYAYWPLLSKEGDKLCFRVAPSVASGQASSELWVVDLRTGRTARLFDGQPVVGYDISRDDRVVAAIPESDGKTRLWLAWLDGREPPTRVPAATGDNPRFGARGEIVFRAMEGSAQTIAAVRENGSGRNLLSTSAGMVFGVASPDGKWVSVQGPVFNDAMMSAVSTIDDQLVPILPATSRLRWSADASRVYISIQHADATAFGSGRTYALRLAKGSMLPRVPPGGFRSEAELAAWPGVETIPHGDFAPGPTPDVYAFSRTTTTRNLYRIPLP